ncbi:MAG: Rieske 2Fe-2S domain-containing protein [Stellaceae bacterium]
MAQQMPVEEGTGVPEPTGPGTLAGRYLRRFWQPIYHAADLAPGRIVPLRIMGQDFALYRGEGGAPHLMDPRCPHRGTQLSAGWIEGDCLRCFYHGWKYDADGRCVEQPTEDSAFAHKVSIRSYPVRDYLGLVFAWLGEGDGPPEFPRHPEFERFAGMIEVDSYLRECNYFQNLENALDMSHVWFVHADNRASFSGIGHGGRLEAPESNWGVSYTFIRADGARRTQQFGMPNLYYMTALPNDPEIGFQESLFWWVPIDDGRHMQFSLHRVPAAGETGRRIRERRQQRRSEIDLPHQRVAIDVLKGRLPLSAVDKRRVDLVRLQDDIAQQGQGRIADRGAERLGRGDVGVIAIRKLWARELKALAAGRPLKPWRRDQDIHPIVWGISGALPRDSGAGSEGAPEIVDVRPHVEIGIQLAALHGEDG